MSTLGSATVLLIAAALLVPPTAWAQPGPSGAGARAGQGKSTYSARRLPRHRRDGLHRRRGPGKHRPRRYERMERLRQDLNAGPMPPMGGPFFPTPLAAPGKQPWAPHQRTGLVPKGRGLIKLDHWPDEPPSPPRAEVARLARALQTLATRPVPDQLVQRLAAWIVRYAQEFGVDPFLLGALAQTQSSMRPRHRSPLGLGLMSFQPKMYAGRFKDGWYRYRVKVDGAWRPRRLRAGRFPFRPKALRNPEASIYFAALIMRTLFEQCPQMDAPFRSVPHRHPVAHFIWGDRVRGAGVEDRVLRDRRRLIAYYLGVPPFPRGRFGSQLLYSPLDGPPRKVTGVLGDDREGGLRRHTGIDFDSSAGEPVHAVAAGKVILAGVDWGHNRLRSLDPNAALLLPLLSMGPRGLLVMIEHKDGLVSTYMHLSAYVVRAGQRVRGGQILGYVGRTGIKVSPAHLHFDMRKDGDFIDPMPYLRPYVFRPEETYVGRRKAVTQRHNRVQRWRRRRRKMWLRRRMRGETAKRPMSHRGNEGAAGR